MKYHMQKMERQIKDDAVIQDILMKGKYTVISMCRNNEPYIVTLSYGYDENRNALYFHTGKKGLKLEFIKENPSVCATIIKDEGYNMNDCSHSYSSAVIWGNMCEVDDLEEKKHGMDVLFTHLEENPEPIKQRIFKNDEVYKNITILKLNIVELTGKRGS